MCCCAVVCSACYVLFFASVLSFAFVFFFNATATTEIYTLSLHDALPICRTTRRPFPPGAPAHRPAPPGGPRDRTPRRPAADRKSTRLNSSHLGISYAVFCLKKKKTERIHKIEKQWTISTLHLLKTRYTLT